MRCSRICGLFLNLIARAEPPISPAIDLEAERRNRERRAVERERIGLAGEEYVHRTEVEKLIAAGRHDLAARVSLVSIEDASAGFDVKSFQSTGEEIHIEVKTTSRSLALDMGFWLTALERDTAGTDPRWTLFRVCDINNSPHATDLGNVVTSPPRGWSSSPSAWFFVGAPMRLAPNERLQLTGAQLGGAIASCNC